MDTIHDLGGVQGFGPIPNVAEDDSVQFSQEWKARIWAIAFLTWPRFQDEETGWTLDWYRHVLERLPPNLYLGFDYFEKWILAMMTSTVDEGIASVDEFANGRAKSADITFTKNPLILSDDNSPARFKPGDRVATRHNVGSMHTRLPAYARGREGTVEGVIGNYHSPDLGAQGQIAMRPVYVVQFKMCDLWPESADSTDLLNIDVWDGDLNAV